MFEALDVKHIFVLLVSVPPLAFLFLGVEGPPNRFTWWQLWFASGKSTFHRIGGLCYLVSYMICIILNVIDFSKLTREKLLLFPLLQGVFQAGSARIYFKHLPKRKEDPGVLSERGTVTYNYVKENFFFQLLLLFTAVRLCESYDMHDSNASYRCCSIGVKGNARETMTKIFQITMTFFPFFTLRRIFPKTRTTSIRAGLRNLSKTTSRENRKIYLVGAQFIKASYIANKWFLVHFCNYLLCCDSISRIESSWVALSLLIASGTVTISMFLHTLRFKMYLEPLTSFSWMNLLALASFVALIGLSDIYIRRYDLLCLVLLGSYGNLFFSVEYQLLLQLFSWLYCTYSKVEHVNDLNVNSS